MEKVDTFYCHFAFRRPKGKNIGYFAAALYSDFEGKKCVIHKTRALTLWSDHQFITAIQSYEHALRCIAEWQGILMQNGVNQIMLVTDNSILEGWIENPKKNKNYTPYMNKALADYRIGGRRQIELGIGLCQARKYEKSYKYCCEKYVIDEKDLEIDKISTSANYKIKIDTAGFKKASDIVKEEGDVEFSGVNEVEFEESLKEGLGEELRDIDVNSVFA